MKLGDTLKQILVPMVTPFTRDDQSVDYRVLEQLIEHLISHNYCDTLIAEGTTGEFNTLLFEERMEMLGFVQRTVAGRRPIVAGTGAASTKETVALTREAERLGYDAVMIVAPYYCKPTQEGIFQHYRTVANATSIPIMLYNIPIFTGVNIEPSTVARLAEACRNIVGIKDESGINPTQMTEYARVTPDDFTIYNGDDIMVLCGLVQGAAGVVSGGSHVIGNIMRDMIEAFVRGDVKKAEAIHKNLDPFFKSLGPVGGVNPIPGLRAAIEMIGIPVGGPRLPLAESTAEEKRSIARQLERMGVDILQPAAR